MYRIVNQANTPVNKYYLCEDNMFRWNIMFDSGKTSTIGYKNLKSAIKRMNKVISKSKYPDAAIVMTDADGNETVVAKIGA